MKGILVGVVVFIVLVWVLGQLNHKDDVKMHEEKEIMLDEKY